jgi:hypothetical protein
MPIVMQLHVAGWERAEWRRWRSAQRAPHRGGLRREEVQEEAGQKLTENDLRVKFVHKEEEDE